METLSVVAAVLGVALVLLSVAVIMAVVGKVKRMEALVSEITQKLEEVRQQQVSQGEKLVVLSDALAKIQADETTLLAEIEALKEQVAGLDTAEIIAKIGELAALAQGNLDNATAAAAKAQEIDSRVPETPDPGQPA
jgi:uncharacterized protein YlxW (UPF0749 family)